MDIASIWAKALNIDSSKLEELKASTPADISLIHHCLLTGIVESSVYFDWAMEFYQLAKIDDLFFDSEVAKQFASEWTQRHSFSKNVVPVAEFDGTVFVACSDPSHIGTYPFIVKPLLANPIKIAELWSNTVQEHAKAEVIANSNPAIESQKLEAVPAPPQVEPPINATADILPEDTPAQIPDSMPEGLDLSDMGPSAEENHSDPFASMMDDVSDEWKPTEDSLPQTDSSILEPTQFSVVADAPQGLSYDVEESQTEEPLLEQTQMKSSMPEAMVDHTFPDAPVEATMIHSETQLDDKHLVNTDEEQPPQPLAPVESPDNVTSINQEILDGGIHVAAPGYLDEADNLEEQLSWYCKELQQKYKSVMFLTFHNDHYQAWKWDNTWKTRPGADAKIQLRDASLFKITNKTNIPYHGKIAHNPIHDKFFNDFIASIEPEIVTTLPITNVAGVWGLILCVGDSSANNIETLKFAENLGKNFAEGLKSGILKVA